MLLTRRGGAGAGVRVTTRLKQILLITVGSVAAVAMVLLGLWQMQVFVDSGNRGIEERAAQPPVALAENMTAGEITGDVYGKQVWAEGVYRPDQEILLSAAGEVRVLTAFELDDGRILPVVRGVVTADAEVPAPPAGNQRQTGLLLPGEGNVDGTAPGELASVRMPALAQRWPQHLVAGFITLNADEATAQGLTAAPVALPEGEGSVRNSGYALQWWVFAAFAVGMSVRIAWGMGRRDRLAAEQSARNELGGAAPDSSEAGSSALENTALENAAPENAALQNTTATHEH